MKIVLNLEDTREKKMIKENNNAEIEILNNLKSFHINILNIYHRFVDRLNPNDFPNWDFDKEFVFNNTLFIILPIFEKNLKQIITINNFIYSDIEILFYLKQLLQSITFLKSNKLVHRDIKPDNIIIDKFGILKLIDFGFCIDVSDFDDFKVPFF
jgi:serine/threonine protein kinase